MEVFYTVVDCRKKDDRPFTEKAFLGRLSESIVAHYLEKEKKWKVLARNQHFKFTEVDILAFCPKTKTDWIVEVRARHGSSHPPVFWLSSKKVKKLQSVANLLAIKKGRTHRILFVQLLIQSMQTISKYEGKTDYQVRAELSDFEIDANTSA